MRCIWHVHPGGGKLSGEEREHANSKCRRVWLVPVPSVHHGPYSLYTSFASLEIALLETKPRRIPMSGLETRFLDQLGGVGEIGQIATGGDTVYRMVVPVVHEA